MDFFDENKTPKEKFFEIIENANKNIVYEELENVFKRLSALEILARECYDDYGDEVDQKINEIIFSKSSELEQEEMDFYVHTMANIVSKNG